MTPRIPTISSDPPVPIRKAWTLDSEMIGSLTINSLGVAGAYQVPS